MKKLGIPVVTGWNSIDCMYDTDPLYVGRAGHMGDRAGNFAVQNSDLLLSLGSRLSIRQVGYNYPTWARAAYVIYNDIDEFFLPLNVSERIVDVLSRYDRLYPSACAFIVSPYLCFHL